MTKELKKRYLGELKRARWYQAFGGAAKFDGQEVIRLEGKVVTARLPTCCGHGVPFIQVCAVCRRHSEQEAALAAWLESIAEGADS